MLKTNRKASCYKENKMNSIIRHNRKTRAFTIIELLTVMSIIVILIGLLVPALNKVRQYAKTVRQKAQFHSMDAAIELFNNEFDGYPPSNALDESNASYCGAMKLCEAMMGRDLLGFHPRSVFRQDGKDRALNPVYLPDSDNLKARKGPFLPLESANAYKLIDIYGQGNTGNFLADTFVLCDVFTRQFNTGTKAGMPILYYRADPTGSFHDPNVASTPQDNRGNIYNYWDNMELLGLGKPWESGTLSKHKLADKKVFYECTRSDRIQYPSRPYRDSSYILISAGFDGEYGTADDVYNFEWKAR